MNSDLIRIRPGAALWPRELDGVEAPPETLWLRGAVERLAEGPRVALVGTRSPTPYGLAQAERFAAELAAAGVCVVSGLARGVDAAAHAAALAVGGATVAVLASGVDRPWPDGPLARRVADEGVLLSEYEPGTPPSKPRFPLRNRLISGLSAAVVVVEAAYRSGSLITARWAADQGREVLAVPGRVDQPMARGCHRLLREGAALVEDPREVLDLLGTPPAEAPAPAPADEHPSDPARRALLEALAGETPSAAELATRLDRPLPELLAQLATLELEGRVARAPGGLYRLTSVLERGAPP